MNLRCQWGEDSTYLGTLPLSSPCAQPDPRCARRSAPCGGPQDRGGMGAPAGHRYCADAVVGYWRKVTLRAPAGIRQNPAGHASVRPRGHRDGGEAAWRLYPSAACHTWQRVPNTNIYRKVVSEPASFQSAERRHIPKNSSGVMPACNRMARRVPSGMSPGWLGMVV